MPDARDKSVVGFGLTRGRRPAVMVVVYVEVDIEVGDKFIVKVKVSVQTKTLPGGNAHEGRFNKRNRQVGLTKRK